jgi:hypothetical protein
MEIADTEGPTMAQQMHAEPAIEARPAARPPAGTRSGWLTFAAAMFLASAAINTLYGIAALVNDDYFAADELLFGDMAMWGLIYLFFAASALVIALLILRRSGVGIALGALVALLHGTIVLISIAAYPVWSVVLLAIDGLIIYGLCVHGPEELA